jgi:hypothetical protein
MVVGDSGQGAVLRMAARLARGGGSSELAIYGLSFQRHLHLRHRDDAVNLSRLLRNDDGSRWWLATVRQFRRSSMVAGVMSGSAPAPRRRRGASQRGPRSPPCLQLWRAVVENGRYLRVRHIARQIQLI